MAISDKKVMDLIGEVKKRKAEIGRLSRPSWKTNCVFPWLPAGGDVNAKTNLHACSDVNTLLLILSHLTNYEAQFARLAKLHDVKATFRWGGFTFDEWSEDIITRVDVLQINEKKAKLAALEARLDRIVSPELRAEMELDEISKELGV